MNMKNNLIFLTILFFQTQLISQESQAGGFVYGWENYDNSDAAGLGQKMIEFEMDGIREIVHAPAIGIHPRIFFGPSEIPDLKNRLQNTNSGQAVSAQIHAFTTLLHLSASNYNHNSTYGSDAIGNRYIDNAGFWDSSAYYSKLKNEDASVWDDTEIKRKHLTSCLMALEAFECLLHEGEYDEDTQMEYDTRAADLGKAMAFWASLVIDDPTVNASSNNFNHFGGTHMALAYDLNYNSMTTAQRDLVRQALSQIIPDEPRHGAHLPAYANQSNWTTLNSFEIITNLAIEGEAGYKENMTERWMRTYHNFITYGWYESGAGYEGLGKNYQFVTTMIACAKRGYSLLGHPHVRVYGNDFLPAITQPFGYGFTSYDVWGGSGHHDELGGYKFSAADAVGLKWAFPNDENIDFVWRNYIEKNNGISSDGYYYQQIRPDDSYYNYLIPAAVFCQDYKAATIADKPINTDYFADDRGLAVFKSSTDKDALAVQFHCRQDMGGHTHGDRNDFTLSALGRVWIRKSYGGSQFQPTWFHSCILIDDKGIGIGDPDGDKSRQPGTILDYQSNENLSMIAGDATYPYTWEWHWSPQTMSNDHPWLGSNGWEAVTETWNDFQYIERNDAHFDIPFYEYPHWHQADRYERMVKRPYNPMEKVYRTIGMVRGEHPFVLIVDDLKKDEQVHNFKWLAQLARDLEIESSTVNLENENYQCDIILKEPANTGNRRLLVRILNSDGYDESIPPAVMDTLEYFDYFSGNPYNSNPNYVRPRLIVESNSIEPDFKILLFPFVENESLPITNWNTSKDTLAIVFGSEKQLIAFPKDNIGRTQIELVEEVITDLEIIENQSINVFPNPAHSFIQVDNHLNFNNLTIKIFDSSGRFLLEKNIQNAANKISIEQLDAGIYWYEISQKEQVLKTGKLVKM